MEGALGCLCSVQRNALAARRVNGDAKLSPNLAVWISNGGRPLMTDAEHWADYTRLIEGWRSRLAPGNLLRLENNRYHIFGDIIPHPVPRGVARDIKMLKGISLGDTGEQSQVNGTWRALWSTSRSTCSRVSCGTRTRMWRPC